MATQEPGFVDKKIAELDKRFRNRDGRCSRIYNTEVKREKRITKNYKIKKPA